MKKYLLSIYTIFFPSVSVAGSCDYSWQRDSAGKRCSGRAEEVIPVGRLGGDGKYTDSYDNSMSDSNFNYYSNQQYEK